MTSRGTFFRGARSALPIAAAYLPVAFALGAASSRLGFSSYKSALWSAVLFSGANQALMLSSLATGTPFPILTVLCAVASLRHVLYGIVLSHRISARTLVRTVFGYGLTDEVFATALNGGDGPERKLHGPWLVGLSVTALSVWIIGTGCGNVVGDVIQSYSPKIREALDFALPALFVALIWSMVSRKMIFPFISAAGLALCMSGLGLSELAIPAGAIAALLPSRDRS